jgi:hypothetical protein
MELKIRHQSLAELLRLNIAFIHFFLFSIPLFFVCLFLVNILYAFIYSFVSRRSAQSFLLDAALLLTNFKKGSYVIFGVHSLPI